MSHATMLSRQNCFVSTNFHLFNSPLNVCHVSSCFIVASLPVWDTLYTAFNGDWANVRTGVFDLKPHISIRILFCKLCVNLNREKRKEFGPIHINSYNMEFKLRQTTVATLNSHKSFRPEIRRENKITGSIKHSKHIPKRYEWLFKITTEGNYVPDFQSVLKQ